MSNSLEQKNDNEERENSWKQLHRISAYSIFVTIGAIITSIIMFFIWPPFPDNIFEIIHTNLLAGIISLDILYVIAVLFTLPLLLSLYTILRDYNKSISLLAFVLGIMSIILLLLARPIIEIVALSNKIFFMQSELEKQMLITMGKAILEYFNGTFYYIHIVFGNTSFLLSAILMRNCVLFKKSTSILGIITNAVAFGILIPKIGPFFGFFFLLGFIPWLLLISITLLKMTKNVQR